MGNNKSRAGVLVGLGAAAGVFGVAAMMSAATAPTARADDFTDVINAVEGDFTDGQIYFGLADTDFSGGDVNDGLAAVFSGVDADFVGAPNSLYLGAVELLVNEPVTGAPLITGFPAESDFASGLAEAETFLGYSQSYSTTAATDLLSGDYVDAAAYSGLASTFDVASLQVLLEGVVASF